MNQREHIAELFGDRTIEVPAAALFRALAVPTVTIEPSEYQAVERAFTTASIPRIGERWEGEGGIYVGAIRGETQDRHIIFGGVSTQDLAWGGYGKEVDGALSLDDGRSNTLALIEDSHEHPAAKWAHEFRADGHSDFCLPAQRELMLLWINAAHLLPKKYVWSSTQYSAYFAWDQYFDSGNALNYVKSYEASAVAVRSLIL